MYLHTYNTYIPRILVRIDFALLNFYLVDQTDQSLGTLEFSIGKNVKGNYHIFEMIKNKMAQTEPIYINFDPLLSLRIETRMDKITDFNVRSSTIL